MKLRVAYLTTVLLLAFTTLAHAAAFTASVSGNWNSSATWGGAGVPGSGDTCTINSGVTVTITALATCGATTNNGTLAIGSSEFDLNGAFTPTSNSTLSCGAGGILDLKGFNITPSSGPISYNFVGSGGAYGAPCTIKSTGSAGKFLDGAFVINNTSSSCVYSGLGSSSILGRTQTSAVTNSWTDCLFTGMAEFSLDGTGTNANAGFIFSNNDIRNPNAATQLTGTWGGTAKHGTGSRQFNNNTSDGGGTLVTLDFSWVGNFAPTGNILKDTQLNLANGASVTDAGNFYSDVIVSQPGSPFYVVNQTPDTIGATYYYYEGGQHPFGGTPSSNFTLNGAIMEQGLGISGVGTNWILGGAISSADWEIKNCIGIGIGWGILVTITQPSNFTLNIHNCTFVVSNEDENGSGIAFAPALITEQSGTLAGSINVYNNLQYDITQVSSNQDALIDLLTNTANQVTEGDYNAASPKKTFYGANVVTTGLGAHDFLVNPMFTDPSRKLATWDATLGGPGTAAHAVAQFLQLNGNGGSYNTAYNISALISYIQQGFTPRNGLALGTSGQGGTYIGAVAPIYANSTLSTPSKTPLSVPGVPGFPSLAVPPQ